MNYAPLPNELTDPLPSRIDLRLVVSDMDGTLMDGTRRVPAGFTDMAARMRSRGILFVPASGRQLANLHHVLGDAIDDAPVIAENGALVKQGATEIHSDTMSAADVATVVTTVRSLREQGYDVGAVMACKQSAYIERADARFITMCDTYYTALAVVDDLLALNRAEVLKVAVYDFGDAEEGSAAALGPAAPGLQTVVSGKHWTDFMPKAVSKGRALAAIQARFGIAPAQTAVFGDYLNDLDLYDHAELSFAVANAHPRITATARYRAPANTEDGVLRTIAELLTRQG